MMTGAVDEGAVSTGLTRENLEAMSQEELDAFERQVEARAQRAAQERRVIEFYASTARDEAFINEAEQIAISTQSDHEPSVHPVKKRRLNPATDNGQPPKLKIDRCKMRDRKSTRLNSSHQCLSRMPSSA